jgi:demethylmenaquinone methyltransferase/2-methoxy-6-polyprenyl-1,4-benzoquinol methylase
MRLVPEKAIPDAQAIFDGVAENYDRPARICGLGQYEYWQRELVGLVVPTNPRLVLDMCTGTGLIAAELRRQTSARVVGADLSRSMLGPAQRRDPSLQLVQADARRPPFASGMFDAVVFSYLLRYVDDVPGTLAALAALVRHAGTMAALEFGLPKGPWRPVWQIYTRALMPAGLSLISPGWRRVGGFLGRSITDFYERWPLERQLGLWRECGFRDVQSRSLSLGGGLLIWGTRS